MINEVARRYARALYELAKTSKNSERVFSELRTLKEVFASNETISEFILSPVIPPDQKIAALKGALEGKLCPELTQTLLLLAEKNRLPIFMDMADAFEAISDEDHGVTRGTVRSAKPLSPEVRKDIEDKVTQVIKKKVILNFSEDAKLLGGMVAQVGGWTFDDSLETHLTRMSEELNRRTH
ncbi:MAG: ATP synthase F1 subunit delta [Bdellovibrio sp. CG10_big_fil_rev_8_21_14_0_10_47_8]|nr:MAG: ATP synthase F1 subunit delta [Bdellovibrio sp. CG10_big_fil_rev_8_21_14_0_10_47_8]